MKYTPEFLRECFDYNQDTGVVRWRVRPLSHFKSEGMMRHINRKCAGAVCGSPDGSGHLAVKVCGKTTSLHRAIMSMHLGRELRDGEHIDHINHNRSDNRICNLRIVSGCSENNHNRCIGARNKSGCLGVFWRESSGRWVAHIRHNRKSVWLGTFSNKDDAIKARKDAERKYGFHPNHGSAPQGDPANSLVRIG